MAELGTGRSQVELQKEERRRERDRVVWSCPWETMEKTYGRLLDDEVLVLEAFSGVSYTSSVIPVVLPIL